MPSLSLPDRFIWFSHCPKAGGTSVERALVDRWGPAVGHLQWGWDLWWRRGGWRRADPPNSPQHLTWADAVRVLPRVPDAVFALVRDPVDRLISEYRYQRQARRGTWLGRLLAHLPFSTWAMIMLRVARANPYAFDNHLRPQADFIPDGARVFRLEDGMEPVGEWLADKTGEFIDHFAQDLAARDRTPLWVYREDLELIARAYGEDYARFAIDLPSPDGLPADRLRNLRAIVAAALTPVVLLLDRTGRL